MLQSEDPDRTALKCGQQKRLRPQLYNAEGCIEPSLLNRFQRPRVQKHLVPQHTEQSYKAFHLDSRLNHHSNFVCQPFISLLTSHTPSSTTPTVPKETPAVAFHQPRAGNEKFILKNVPSSQFEYIRSMYYGLNNSQFLRLSEDVVPEQSIFVYRYLADHLLSFVRKELPVLVTKRILKDTLHGLAALHEQNIVHTDIKPNNIFVDWESRNDRIAIKQVKLADIEDAVSVEPNSDIVGVQVGNLMWRSPEAHAQARVNKPSDVFSFGVVCIYAMTKQVIFAIGEEDIGEGEEPLAVILERQISYFADEEGLNGLLKHLGDSPWRQVLEVLRDGFNQANPRKPVSLWKGIDEDFRDLITGLTKFDPAQRLTAKEALNHRWFGDVE